VRDERMMSTRLSSVWIPAVLALVLGAAPALATYTISNAAFTEGGGKGSDGRYDILFTTGQGAPVGVSGESTFGLTSGLIYTISGVTDVTGPMLSHVPTALAREHEPVEVAVTATDAKSGVDTVTLFYHEGGLTTFRRRQMQPDAGNVYRGTILASLVDERGLVYYIRASDKAGNVSLYPPGAPDSVVRVRVWFNDVLSAVELPAGGYRMISLPCSTSGDPDSILVDDLGAYDKKAWRLGRWNASAGDCGERCYDEYPSIEDLSRGRGFWLISSSAKRFDVSGLSTDISRPFTIPLKKGWNQIGTPFAFTTDWPSTEVLFDGGVYSLGKHPVGSDTVWVKDNLISYDGSYEFFETELQPWVGYWIDNQSTQDVELRFYPEIPVPRLAGAPAAADRMTSLMGITITWGKTGERMSFAGTSPAALDGLDELDHREPPPIGDYVRVVFEKDTWGRHSGAYMCDIRAANPDGASWELKAQTTKPTAVALDVEPLIDLPDGWMIALYDVSAGIRLTAAALPHSFMLEGSKELLLIAGTEHYIATQEACSGLSLRTQIVSVSPNPFSRAARISFFIPKRESVRLDVFSVDGRLVRTLADSRFEPGIHTATWQGESSSGGQAAPGLYFLRLETSGTVNTAKILRLR
jgi:hypothetical protein